MIVSKSVRKRLAVQAPSSVTPPPQAVSAPPADHDSIAAIDNTRRRPYHRCVACGARIRWALKSCYDCNAPLVEDSRGRRFLHFT